MNFYFLEKPTVVELIELPEESNSQLPVEQELKGYGTDYLLSKSTAGKIEVSLFVSQEQQEKASSNTSTTVASIELDNNEFKTVR